MISTSTSTSSSPIGVLKFGGEVVADPVALVSVLREVAQLVGQGWRFLLCHGGGPQANALGRALGLETQMVGGRRVTDAATLSVMKQTLGGEVSINVVAAAQGVGLSSVGLSGVSSNLVSAKKRPPKIVSGSDGKEVDFGFVGDIQRIEARVLTHLWEGGFTPVVNTLGVDPEPGPDGVCQVFNINADTVSSAIAAELQADHLFLMTGVPGVLGDKDDSSTRIPALNESTARDAIRDGVIVGGMIPKIEEALKNLSRGVKNVHILGSGTGDLLGEAQQGGARGTVLTLA